MADKIIFADDSAFFVETADAPAALSENDARDFVRTWVESSSPVPPDKLRIGFWRENGKAVVFAGIEERVFGAFNNAAITSADYFVPAASLVFICALEGEKVVLRSAHSLSMTKFDGGKFVDFAAVPATSDAAADLKNLRDAAGSKGGETFYEISKVSLNGKAVVEFLKYSEKDFAERNEADAEKISRVFPKKLFASLDVRDMSAMRAVLRKRRRDGIKAWGMKLVPVLAALLLLGQISVWFKSAQVQNLREEAAKLAPQAKEIESISERLAEFRMFSDKQMRPTDAVAIANMPRPDEVRFARVAQTSPRDAEIQGSAPSIGAVHAYAKLLRDDSKIEKVSVKTETARGEARFTFNVKFK